ncbi:hypothetical protein, partial [Paenibacillus sp. 598K]|uniref:hypothetical protein n=1 Tax=Paenibacillus sp. 598K TaxID=1117987 RepID=UPI001C876081
FAFVYLIPLVFAENKRTFALLHPIAILPGTNRRLALAFCCFEAKTPGHRLSCTPGVFWR